MSWCLQQNELNKPVGRRNEGEPGYPEDMYQIMLQAAWNTGLFDHVGHDTQVVAAIGARFYGLMHYSIFSEECTTECW